MFATYGYAFPDPRKAPPQAPLAYGGDLSVKRLLVAYSQGIFPWYREGEPICWWCPHPRSVLPLPDFHIPHGLKRVIKDPAWRITYDTAFVHVIRACATVPRSGQRGSWITPEMIDAYCVFHEAGYAHSVECWRNSQLAGGLYGVSLGGIFFGESMFYFLPNASKIAFAQLLQQLITWNFTLVDCQMPTPHLTAFGAHSIPRPQFFEELAGALQRPTRRGPWKIE